MKGDLMQPTHQLWADGKHMFNFDESTKTVLTTENRYWVSGFTIERLSYFGYECREIDFNLENE